MKGRVYCSGPLFSSEERAIMALIARTLEEAGYETFLPQRDGLEAPASRLASLPGAGSKVLTPVAKRVRKAMFALDVFQLLERCDALVFDMNGRVPDEGGAVEAALAFAAGKPLVLYKDDWRSTFDGHDNPMITGLTATFSTVGSVGSLPEAVDRELARVARLGAGAYAGQAVPPHVRDTVDLGRRTWRLLCAWRERVAADGDGADADLLAEVAATAFREQPNHDLD